MSTPDPNNPYAQPPQQPYGQQAPQGVPQQGGPGYGYPQYPQGGGQPAYGAPQQGGPNVASMGQRLGARVIDWVLLSVIGIALSFAGVGGFASEAEQCTPGTPGYEQCISDATGSMLSTLIPLMLMYGLLALLYEVVLIAVKGATVGKMALGLRVAKAETGQNPGFGGSILRWLIPYVGAFLCGIGQILVYLSPFFDKSGKQQGWHDKAAGTVVVRTK